MMNNKEDLLFHYCSVETFFHIISGTKLWLSDIEKSNDYQECIVCREYVNEKLREYLKHDTEALEAWDYGYKEGIELNTSIKTFAVCFSEAEDRLSQWRGYAQDGTGIAIGFNKHILEELNLINRYHIAFGKVVYNNPDEYAKEIVEDNIKKLENKGVGHVALELSSNYRLKFPFVKNPGFIEEGEWRVVIGSTIGKYNIPSSEKIKFSKIKYRVSEDKLIPYIEMDFEKAKQDIIRKIIIGPKAKITIEDVVDFLNFCGYYENVEGGYNSTTPICVRKSITSYR